MWLQLSCSRYRPPVPGLGFSKRLGITIRSGPLLVSGHSLTPVHLSSRIADTQLLSIDQSFVFLSRSSLSLGLPAIPLRLLPLPSIIQFFILTLLSLQSSRFIFSAAAFTPPAPPPNVGVDRSITIVFLLMCLEGLCGGSAYVNTFYHVGREGEDGDNETEEGMRRKMEKEFRIGAVGAADSCGESSTLLRMSRCCMNWIHPCHLMPKC